MKKLTLLIALFIFALSAQAQQTLVYSDHEPLGGMRTRFINDVFFPAIEKESNGRLKIDAHWGGEIASGYDALRVVGKKEGMADMAIVVPEYTANNLPLHQIFKSFPVGPSGDKQVAFFRRSYAEIPMLPAELEKENVVNILFTTGFPVAFLSDKPLNSLNDIKGGTWRSASFWQQAQLRNAGGTAVTMSWGEETFKALRAGTINGLMVNIDSSYDINAHKIATNILVSKELWLGHVYLLVMNKNTWDGLAKEDKEAIQRAAETAYKTLGSVMDSSFDSMIATMKNDGAKIRILEPAEVEQWKAMTKYEEVQAAWAKEQESKGVKDASSTLEKIRTIMSNTETAQDSVVAAKDLYDAFKNDNQAAGELYSKKTINVKGFVVYAGPDPYGLPSVELSDTKEGKGRLLCVLPASDYLKLRKVSKGEEVIIRGEVRALYEKGDMVLLKQCEIVENPKETAKS